MRCCGVWRGALAARIGVEHAAAGMGGGAGGAARPLPLLPRPSCCRALHITLWSAPALLAIRTFTAICAVPQWEVTCLYCWHAAAVLVSLRTGEIAAFHAAAAAEAAERNADAGADADVVPRGSGGASGAGAAPAAAGGARATAATATAAAAAATAATVARRVVPHGVFLFTVTF